jgi:hypothetical protein
LLNSKLDDKELWKLWKKKLHSRDEHIATKALELALHYKYGKPAGGFRYAIYDRGLPLNWAQSQDGLSKRITCGLAMAQSCLSGTAGGEPATLLMRNYEF